MKILLTIIYCLLVLGLKAQQNLSDTLTVDTNSVVFFSLSELEFDSLYQIDSDVNEAVADFNYYATKIKKPIEQMGYKYLFTAHRFYKIVTSKSEHIFDRNQAEHVLGIIMNNGVDYKIDLGVDTDVGYLSTIKRFMSK